MVFLSLSEIHENVDWLLQNASPPVKYLTHRDLLKTDPQSEPMLELWKGVESSSAA